MFLARFPQCFSVKRNLCSSPTLLPTLRSGLYHVPVAGVGAGLSGAASHIAAKTKGETHAGRGLDISDMSQGVSHQPPLKI